jgi:hypothetical protein
VLTCSSPQSRNMSVGLALGQRPDAGGGAWPASCRWPRASPPPRRCATSPASSASRPPSARPVPPSWPARWASTTPIRGLLSRPLREEN